MPKYISPAEIKKYNSYINVEKVLNPPHKPTVNPYLRSSMCSLEIGQVDNIMPNNRQLIILAVKVPHGHEVTPSEDPLQYLNNIYRLILPIAPPKPIKRYIMNYY